MKAVPATRSTRNDMNSSYRSTTDVASAATDPTMTQTLYTELLDKFADQKKQKRAAEQEKIREIQEIQKAYDKL